MIPEDLLQGCCWTSRPAEELQGCCWTFRPESGTVTLIHPGHQQADGPQGLDFQDLVRNLLGRRRNTFENLPRSSCSQRTNFGESENKTFSIRWRKLKNVAFFRVTNRLKGFILVMSQRRKPRSTKVNTQLQWRRTRWSSGRTS